MKIHYQCSNCGKRFQSSAMIGVPDGMYYAGCRAVGDAFYCEDCVRTWKNRNGKNFDDQYKLAGEMFRKWWNGTVDAQAKLDGKKLKSYRRTVCGEYVSDMEVEE